MPTVQLTAADGHCLQGGCYTLPTHTAGFWCSIPHLMIVVCNFGDGAVIVSIVCLTEGQGRATNSAWHGPIVLEVFWGLKSCI